MRTKSKKRRVSKFCAGCSRVNCVCEHPDPTLIFTPGAIIVDEEDEHLLEAHSWCFKDGKYPLARIKGKNVYLHHLILKSTFLVDHIDRNPLNNRRSNLRPSNKSTNSMNSKLRTDNTSGIKGVSWNKEKSLWEVYITKNKNRHRLGYFKELKDAALKRADAEMKVFGEFANRELINDIYKNYG